MQITDVVAPTEERASRGSALSRWVGIAILFLVGALVLQVFFEGWLVTWFGTRTTDAQGLVFVEQAGWPKTVKITLYVILFVLTAVKFTVDRAWHTLTTKADIALLVLGVVMAVAGVVGGSSALLIGQALFVYFRGVIVFYAFRALRPSWAQVKPLLWIGGTIVAVNTLIGVVQFWVGESAYTALGWVDPKWISENRAHGLLEHPNDLGHLASFMLLGLLSWFMTTERVAKRWWFLYALICVAVSVAQSRQSMVAVIAAFAAVALLRRNRWKRLILAGTVFVFIASLPVIMSPDNRANLAYRLGGAFNALLLWGGYSAEECRRDPRCSGPGDAEIRLVYIPQGLKLFAASPVLGYGVGQFGGIVAVRADEEWNKDPRFVEVLGPEGFDLHDFIAVSVDVFWLHLLVEVGALGMIAYLVWMWFVSSPMVRLAWRRGPPRESATSADPIYVWAAATLVFALLTAAWSPVLEDPVFPPLMFAVLGFGWVLWQRGSLPNGDTVRAGGSAQPGGSAQQGGSAQSGGSAQPGGPAQPGGSAQQGDPSPQVAVQKRAAAHEQEVERCD
ncbi:MAG TPA: O-antigen ligase family protein [Candidatus Limnocylindrales bacterium]